MNVMLWHVHGSWTTSFVQGGHRYLVPVTPNRGPYGLGRAQTYDWPDTVEELGPAELAGADVDVLVLQRPEERELARSWLGRDLPAVYVEHNTPRGDVPDTRHPMADRDDLVLVHVTHFNELFWDAGSTRTTVIEHGIPAPAARYTGELPRLGVAANHPVRRGRVTGTDLLPRFAAVAPVDVFGMGVRGLAGDGITVHDERTDGARTRAGGGEPAVAGGGHAEGVPQARMHAELSRRRAYVHLTRWTSLGLSLLEAMAMGMPVLALGTTEAASAIPSGAGIVSTRVDRLVDAARWLLADEAAAQRLGAAARVAALDRYGLARFLADWDQLLREVAGCELR